MQRLVSVYRNGRLESFHSGSIAVVDASGRLLAFAGDPSFKTYVRSSAKPIQTATMLLEGAGEEYDLSPEEIALISASHGGEPQHVATAAAILRKGDLDESDLLCGAHTPFDEKAAAELRSSGEPPSPLHNNCSGKHAGMLLTSRLLDAHGPAYTSPDHPLQMTIRQAMADFADMPVEDVQIGVDGCGVPSFYLSVYRSALAYARISASAQGAALPRYGDAVRETIDAMMTHPEMVAGAWSLTTPLMQSFDRQLLAKEGGEGFYAMALLPPLSDELQDRYAGPADSAVGIAIKIHDGSMGRGRNPVIFRVLEELGIDCSRFPGLAPYRDMKVRNVSGAVVGEVKADFSLTVL